MTRAELTRLHRQTWLDKGRHIATWAATQPVLAVRDHVIWPHSQRGAANERGGAGQFQPQPAAERGWSLDDLRRWQQRSLIPYDEQAGR